MHDAIRWFKCKLNHLKILFDVICNMSHKGQTEDQGRGIISLIEKLGKDSLNLSNWWPLSLLNTDTKLYSKILANRLYSVLPQIIHIDQTGFLKGRYIGENLQDILATIEICDRYDLEGVLVALDFEKAFDTCSWPPMYKMLENYNFGLRIIKMIKCLNTNVTSATINFGFTGNWFAIEQGLRQGDCLSPPLFLMIVETLGVKIRQNERIEGITMGHYSKKHSQFADDLWAALSTRQEVLDEFFAEVESFCDFSGLKINYDKTQIMRIGSLKNSDATLYTQKSISWSRRVKILGMTFTPDSEETIEINYKCLMEKMTCVY